MTIYTQITLTVFHHHTIQYTLQHIVVNHVADDNNHGEEVMQTPTGSDSYTNVKGNNTAFTRLDPNDANEVLMSLKKPKLFTEKKESFATSFKTFQVGFARHCALVSCIDEDSFGDKNITLKKIVSLHGKMESAYLEGENSSDSEGDAIERNDSNEGRMLWKLYKNNLRTICKGVFDPMGKPLLHTLRKENLSYKPKQFITLMRQKRKKGLWQDSDGYNADKLYQPFYDVCSRLNLFNEE